MKCINEKEINILKEENKGLWRTIEQISQNLHYAKDSTNENFYRIMNCIEEIDLLEQWKAYMDHKKEED